MTESRAFSPSCWVVWRWVVLRRPSHQIMGRLAVSWVIVWQAGRLLWPLGSARAGAAAGVEGSNNTGESMPGAGCTRLSANGRQERLWCVAPGAAGAGCNTTSAS
jgi:hypothetical protein